MSDFSDFLKNITEGYRERLTTPFFRNFLFGFLLFNWQGIFYLLASKESAIDILYYFEMKYCNWNNFFWFPLAYSICFTIAFHFIAFLFDKPIFFLQRKRKKQKNDFLADNINSRVIVETAKINLEKKKQKALKIEDTNAEIQKLNSELSESVKKHSELMDENKLIKNELNNELKLKKESDDILSVLSYKVNEFVNEKNNIEFAEYSGGPYLFFITKSEINELLGLIGLDNSFFATFEQSLRNPSQLYNRVNMSNISTGRIKNFEINLLKYLESHDFIVSVGKSTLGSLKLTPKGQLLKANLVNIKRE